MTQLEIMGAKAKKASRFLMTAGSKKDEALNAIAKALRENADKIIKANDIDIENGKKEDFTKSLLDRLKLTEERINGMADGERGRFSCGSCRQSARRQNAQRLAD